MAIPLITSVSPITGHAGGGDLVRISGGNFRQYTPPSSGNIQGAARCYVRVSFGSTISSYVAVYATDYLEVLTPSYSGDVEVETFPAVAVTVQNLNDQFAPIAGETVTLQSAYTYAREDLRRPTLTVESPATRITRLLLYILKRELLHGVSPRTHTDYSEDGVDVAKAHTPSAWVLGPDVTPDSYGWENASIEAEQQDGSVCVWPNPIMHTLRYTIYGSSDSQTEFISLMLATRKVFWRNPYMVIDGDVPVGSRLRLPMTMVDEPSPGPGIFNSNLHTFSSKLEIRRVPILYLPPYARVWKVDQMQLQAQKFSGTLVESITL